MDTKVKISFDYDFTLSDATFQNVAKSFIVKGYEIWITTTRFDHKDQNLWKNRDLFSVCEKLGIPKERIQFTNGEEKWKFLDGFDMHFDDDEVTIEIIEENLPNCIAILVNP